MSKTVAIFLSRSSPSPQAQLIAQSIGQAFSVAYREFLRANGINPTELSQKQYSEIINSQEMYHDDLVHFSNSDNCKEVCFFFFFIWLQRISEVQHFANHQETFFML